MIAGEDLAERFGEGKWRKTMVSSGIPMLPSNQFIVFFCFWNV
jgi:hypothetical protein